MDDQTIIVIVALIMLTIVEIAALVLGYNGAMLATVLMIFGGVVGYAAKAKRGP